MSDIEKGCHNTPDTWGKFENETLLFAAMVCLDSRNASMNEEGLHNNDSAPNKMRAILIILLSISLTVISLNIIFDSLAPEAQNSQTHTLSQPTDSKPIGNPIFEFERKPASQIEDVTQTAATAEPDAATEVETVTEVEADTAIAVETVTDVETDAATETETVTDVEADTATETETVTDAEADAATEIETVTDVEADAATEIETVTDVEADAATEIETVTDVEADAATETMPEIAAEAEESTSPVVEESQEETTSTIESATELQLAEATPVANIEPTTNIEVQKEHQKTEEDAVPTELEVTETQEPTAPPVEDYKAEIYDTVTTWAKAWSDQDVGVYLDSYAAKFIPPQSMGRTAWAKQRRQRITRPANIDIMLSNINVSLTEDGTGKANFIQIYKTPKYSDRSRKTLTLIQEADGWKISSEQSKTLR